MDISAKTIGTSCVVCIHLTMGFWRRYVNQRLQEIQREMSLKTSGCMAIINQNSTKCTMFPPFPFPCVYSASCNLIDAVWLYQHPLLQVKNCLQRKQWNQEKKRK
jgi:hypothetical protein